MIDITVVRYFFLFLLIVLYEMSPPTPNNLLIYFGLLTFFEVIFISLFPLIAVIGDVFEAIFAPFLDDK